MSSRYRFHPETGIALLQGEGALTLEDWERTAREILERPGATGTRRILSDRRRMGESFPAWMEQQALAFYRDNAKVFGDVQWAIVVPGDSAALGTVRSVARASEGTRIRVKAFTDLTEALRWLLGAYEDDDITALIGWIEAKD